MGLMDSTSHGCVGRASEMVRTMPEILMRLMLPAAALAALLTLVSSVTYSQRPDYVIDPRSQTLVRMAQIEFAAGRLDIANGLYETALAVDPRNRAAYLAMADIAKKQGLNGKAIRLYREVLLIEPNDVAALAGQGEAMVAKGAVTKARENLARVSKLCAQACPEQIMLSAAIERGAPPTTVSVQAVTPKPTATEGKSN
jgi:tetratricopeptide (TPR) repeat protein